jgi:hypothetical protein
MYNTHTKKRSPLEKTDSPFAHYPLRQRFSFLARAAGREGGGARRFVCVGFVIFNYSHDSPPQVVVSGCDESEYQQAERERERERVARANALL